MAFNQSLIAVLAGAQVFRNAALGGTADAGMAGGASTLYLIQIDNTGNPTQKVYFKLWDAAAPTVGTTAPNKIIPVPGGSIQKVVFPEGIPFGTDVSQACVTTGGTGGTTSPANAVITAITLTIP
jgi:hypothetical protein